MSIDLGFAVTNIIVFFAIAFISVFILWRLRNSIGIKKESVFDIYIVSLILGTLFSRVIHILLNFSEYTGLGWTLYPYYLEPGERKVWLSQDPWIFFRFWDGGFNYLGVVLGVLVGIFLIARYLNIRLNKIPLLILPFATLGLIFNLYLYIAQYFQNDKSLNFSSPIFYEVLIYLVIVFVILLTPKKFFEYLWILIVGGFGAFKILVDERVQSNKILWDLSIYQIIGLLVLIFVVGIVIYTFINRIVRYISDNKSRRVRYNAVNTNPVRKFAPGFVQRKSYSLSFKDMDSISLGSRLLTPFYAIRRKFSKSGRKSE